MPLSSSASAPARKLDAAEALGELVRRDGRMAELCSENGTLRMDWVELVQALLADPQPLEELEELATSWRERGVRHVVWSGMGGSSVAVGVLSELGLTNRDGSPTVHLLDSTDPAALDALLASLGDDDLNALLRDVVLVAVSLGVTSEEPATHLAWFVALLASAGLPVARHTLVLTVPGSRLEEMATLHGLEVRRVHLADRPGFPGRMSAPASAVFLLPLALGLPDATRLHDILERAWAAHDLSGAVEDSAAAAYVRFAEQLAARTRGGACRLMLELPGRWEPMRIWIEQLFEQTLGKDGKGVVVFAPQRLNPDAIGYRDDDLVEAGTGGEDGLEVPLPDPSADARSAIAQAMLGWQVTVALLGHHAGTNVVDEPAVEDYKARARALRGEAEVLSLAVEEGALDWPACGYAGLEPLADTLASQAAAGRLSYLDLTINGELDPTPRRAAHQLLQRLGNDRLGVPVKLRRAPAAYHVSEQCQMDGPPGVVSLRIVARAAKPAVLGDYTPRFLQAQAVATWQAMRGRGRECTLAVVDELDDVVDLLAALEGALGARLGS